MNNNFFDDLSSKLSAALANSPAKDFEKNAKAMISSAFSKLDLVTREEFEVQREMLTRSRERLAQLEARLDEIEKSQKSA